MATPTDEALGMTLLEEFMHLHARLLQASDRG